MAAFVTFREQVITRRTEFELGQARDRAHILLGLAVAVANIDEVIALIRKATDPAVAKQELLARAWPARDIAPLIALVDDSSAIKDGAYKMSEAQAKAILDLRLHRLTGLERDKIGEDLKTIAAQIVDFLDILANHRQNEMDRLVKKLRAAESDLSALEQRQDELRKQISSLGFVVEDNPDGTSILIKK